MAKPAERQHSETAESVASRFQLQLGLSVRPSPETTLDELGVDSIILVTVLFDLSEHLALDLNHAQIDLNELRTIADVVDVMKRLEACSANT